MISAAEHQLLVRAAAVVDGRQVVAHHARVRKLRVIALRDALASARQRLQPTIHRFTSPQHTVTAYISMRPLDGDSVAERLGRWICHQQVASSNPRLPAVKCNPGQVVNNTDVPVTKQYNLVPANGR